MANTKKTKSLKLPIIVSISLSLAIIIIILFYTINTETLQYLSQVSFQWQFFMFLGFAVVLNIFYWCIWGARLKVLSNAVDSGAKIRWWESTKIVIANLFLAGITPSLAGGEPVRIYLLNKDGLSTGCATAVVLGERLIDAFFILMIIPFAFFVFKDRVNVQLISYGLMAGIFVFIVGIIVFVYAIRFPEKTKHFLIFLSTKFARFSKKKERGAQVVKRISTEVDNFHQSMVFFVTKGRRAFAAAGALTVLFWSTGFCIPSMILLALGLPPFFLESFAAQALLLIIVMMPTTPGSSGVTELGMAGLYSVLLGASHEYLLGVFVLLFRLITYHMNLITGAAFQYRIFKSITSFSMETLGKKDG